MFLDICLILQWSECMLNNKRINYCCCCCAHKTFNFLTSNQVNLFHVFFWFSTCCPYQWYFCGFFPLKSSHRTIAFDYYYWQWLYIFINNDVHFIAFPFQSKLITKIYYHGTKHMRKICTLDPFRSIWLQWQTNPHDKEKEKRKK